MNRTTYLLGTWKITFEEGGIRFVQVETQSIAHFLDKNMTKLGIKQWEIPTI